MGTSIKTTDGNYVINGVNIKDLGHAVRVLNAGGTTVADSVETNLSANTIELPSGSYLVEITSAVAASVSAGSVTSLEALIRLTNTSNTPAFQPQSLLTAPGAGATVFERAHFSASGVVNLGGEYKLRGTIVAAGGTISDRFFQNTVAKFTRLGDPV